MPKPPAWDLTALLNAADPKATLAERHLWLIRLLEWLRHAPVEAPATPPTPATPATPAAPSTKTPLPALRLKHLLGVLDRNPDHQARVATLLARFWGEVDSIALLADFGFAPRMDLWGELGRRLRARVLPLSPDTPDLGELFALLFPNASDAPWLLALDNATLDRMRQYLRPAAADGAWRRPFLDAMVFLASAVRTAGFNGALRMRMSPELLTDQPFRQLARVAEAVSEHALSQAPDARTPTESLNHAALLREAQYLRALLEQCRLAADSVREHLEAHGVSVDVVFAVDQLHERTHRIEALLNCVVSTEPAREITRLLAELVQTADARRSIRSLLSRHYSMLARKVAERSAATGEHYITRNRDEYRQMLRAAAGGGAVLAATTFLKFAILALALAPFWGGFWAGVNYAASFVVVQLLHFTVATKQPAMTAPALAAQLAGIGRATDASDDGGGSDAAGDAARTNTTNDTTNDIKNDIKRDAKADAKRDSNVEAFVDEVAHLIRSQAAGIFGNLAAVIPVVLAVQYACRAAFGAPLIGRVDAEHVLASITLLGPTVLFAAFTGVLLFASSLIAGWAENWFVWHRLDSAIAWNPRIVARLGSARAARWGAYWRANVSGLAANISLGLLLGLVPPVAQFFGLPIEVRHVTLSTGQLAAAVGTLGFGLTAAPAFWWCVAGIVATGVLNVGVSFLCAFRVALRSRGIRLADRSRIYRAIRSRLWRAPASFVLPPRA